MNSPRDMFQFTTAALSEQQPTELNLHRDDPLAKHFQKRTDFTAGAAQMTLKWNKPPAGDGSDNRRNFMTSGTSGGISVGSIGVAKGEFLDINSSKESWRSISKAILDSKCSMQQNCCSLSSQLLHQQQQQQLKLQRHSSKDDDSGDETDNTTNSGQTPSHFKRSLNSDSHHSKLSANSFELNDTIIPSYYNLQQKKSSTYLKNDVVHEQSIHSHESLAHKTEPNSDTNWPNTSNMNFIILLGLIVGLVISKTLQYLQLYFSWFQTQVLQLRIALLGTVSIFDFFNFEDTSRFGLRTKLLLLPVVATFSLLYGTIVFFHHVIRFLLTQAPGGLVNFIQKLYMEI